MQPLLTLGALCAFLVSGGAWAGYANASPPAGWTAGTGSERAMFRAAANESWAPDRTVRTTATLNVGGRAVTMPAGMRMAANAGRFAARFAFGNPLLFAAGLALPLAYNWFQGQDFELRGNAGAERWEKLVSEGCSSSCYMYRYNSSLQWYEFIQSAGASAVSFENQQDLALDGVQNYQRTLGTCDAAQIRCQYNYSGAGGSGTGYFYFERMDVGPQPPQYRPATQEEMETSGEATPLPGDVANELGQPLPVDAPVLNPSPLFQPETLRVPVGDPYPVPNTNPQQYKQPVVDVKPSPTELEPWRVDAKPLDVTSEDPLGVEEPESVPQTGTTTAVITPKDEPAPGLCEQFPDILACQKLGTPGAATPIKTQEIAVSMTPDSGWTLGSNSCPAARSVSLAGGQYEFSFQALCDFAAGIRPVIIGMAYLSALLAFFGFARRAT